MNLKRSLLKGLKIATLLSVLIKLNLLESAALAHIYQVNSLKLKSGQIILFFSDAHHSQLVNKSAEVGLDPRRMQELANQNLNLRKYLI